MMKYIHFILTMIFLALCLIIAKMPEQSARASTGVQDVNIRQIGGDSISASFGVLKVEVIE